jgi:hypothetical protein
MGERWTMYKATILLIAFTMVSPAILGGGQQARAGAEAPVFVAPRVGEISAQVRERRRSRVLIERQPAAWDYPRPGTYSWPGPGAVRHCVDWYQLEYRPSGTVLTPQMHCRWVRG